ncbi:MAG: LysM peptidoglycan-binding domain-containing protein [Bacteroidales bacterium]|nr:LysM peptidoglycan-binding domain-containing protein [Bacteroidales bacterium]
MRSILIKSFSIIVSICVGLSASFAQEHNFKDTAFIRESIKYNEYYDFIKFDQNMLEWYQQDAVAPFFTKLGNADKEKVVILHIGDSHIQSDMGSGMSRYMLQSIFGYGGRGMVFPYQAAGTHSAYDYYANSYGNWDNTKNVAIKPKHNLGVSGITIFTTDSTAGFKIIFRRHYYSIQPDFTKIKLYCHKGIESYDALLTYSSKEKPIKVDCNIEDGLPYIEINLPKASDTITVMLNKTDTAQKYFECYGLSIESAEDKGVLYHSVGINGAGYRSMFNQNLMAEQLKSISPDMIILDLGINDFFRGSFNYQYIMSSLNKAIEFFRESVPDAAIMIPNAQDIYFRGSNIKNCQDYSVLTRLVAKEQDVILYDYYNISGGRYSMSNWSKLGLSQRDKTHLSFKGYKLKGELYCNAILNSYCNFLTYAPDSLIAFDNKIDTTDFAKWVVDKSTYYNKQGIASGDKIDNYKNDQTTSTYSASYTGTNPVYYKIRTGDNLGKIAASYGVSVSDIQRWNNMHSTNIYAGKTLLIYPRGYTGSTNNTNNNNTNNNSNQNTSTSGNKVYYTIQRGDNLGAIAIKFGVSVKDIKSWNGLSSDNIVAGKKLVIYTNKTGYVSDNNSNTNNSGLRRTHIVQSGESLWSIAKKYNTSVDKIKKANNLKSDRINVGDKLIIM